LQPAGVSGTPQPTSRLNPHNPRTRPLAGSAAAVAACISKRQVKERFVGMQRQIRDGLPFQVPAELRIYLAESKFGPKHAPRLNTGHDCSQRHHHPRRHPEPELRLTLTPLLAVETLERPTSHSASPKSETALNRAGGSDSDTHEQLHHPTCQLSPPVAELDGAELSPSNASTLQGR
jgi:hypothetical protein